MNSITRWALAVVTAGLALPLHATLFAATLPSSRSMTTNMPVTVFGSIINSSATAAEGCGVALGGQALPLTLEFFATNPQTNEIIGAANVPVDISAGGSASFVLSLTATQEFPVTDVELVYDCASTEPAATLTGINTVQLSASSTASADLIVLAATPSADGVARIVAPRGQVAFALATFNLGVSGELTLTAESGVAELPASVLVCETDPLTAVCLAGPYPAITTVVAANATPTFSVFAAADGGAAFDPVNNRVFVQFRDASGVVRGSSSVALTAPPVSRLADSVGGIWNGVGTGSLAAFNFVAAVSEDGELRYLTDDSIQGFARVSSTADNFSGLGNALTPLGSVWATTGRSDAALLIEGQYVTASSAMGTFVVDDVDAGTFVMSYDTLYERDSSIGALAGNWDLRSVDTGQDAGDLVIRESGHFSGADEAGCSYNGLVSLIDPDFNLYRAVLTVANCGVTSGLFEGLAVLTDGTEMDDTIQFSISSASFSIVNRITRSTGSL